MHNAARGAANTGGVALTALVERLRRTFHLPLARSHYIYRTWPWDARRHCPANRMARHGGYIHHIAGWCTATACSSLPLQQACDILVLPHPTARWSGRRWPSASQGTSSPGLKNLFTAYISLASARRVTHCLPACPQHGRM